MYALLSSMLAGWMTLEPQIVVQTFKKMIGEGSIGRVHLGKWQETDVAIKVLGSLNAVGLAMPGQPVQPALRASGMIAEHKDSDGSEVSGANSYAAEQSMSLKTLEREVSLLPSAGPSGFLADMIAALVGTNAEFTWSALEVLLQEVSFPETLALGRNLQYFLL